MRRYLLGAVTLGALVFAQGSLRAQDMDHDHDHPVARAYYDSVHRDTHHWDDHEVTAWKGYRDEHHVKVVEFDKASKRQQQAYWNWRHDHPDQH